jgi:glutathione S-transferase
MTYTVHGTAASGNCHKVRMALDILGERYEWREIDVLKGESRTPEFLAMNPNGKVPVLAIDDATFLAESNAILWYLGEGTKLVPDDRLARARVLQWMFFEQYSHEPYIAVSRFIRKYLPPGHPRHASLATLQASGDEALAAMERHLHRLTWFGGEHYTIADIALFAYTHVADEAGFDLGAYPQVERWLKHVMQQPGFVPMRND